MSEGLEEDVKNELVKREKEVADRVSWVIETIAGENYVPGPIDQPWAGRVDMILRTQSQFNLDEVEADKLVQQAHETLVARTGDPPPHVARRLKLRRLGLIKKIIEQSMKQQRTERTFKWTPKLDNAGRPVVDAEGKTVMVREHLKDKIYTGIDHAAIGLLLKIEEMEIALLALDRVNEDEDLVASIFAKIDESPEGEEISGGMTITKKIKHAKIDDLPVAKAFIQKAIRGQRKRKSVKSEQKGDDGETDTGQDPPDNTGEAPEGDILRSDG